MATRASETIVRRLPVGAETFATGTHFRVWAPDRSRVTVVLEDRETELEREPDGCFAGLVPGVGHGARYRFGLDGGEKLPDPVSRFQPEGPQGPSMVVDPGRYAWRDQGWTGVPARPVLYELHLGTFTPEGTCEAAAARLPHLAEIGITCIELMPVADFPGGFGWGYDGVALFAPTRLYGEPDDLRAFVDAAHGHGIAVIMDVVYNHIGQAGDVLGSYASAYFSERFLTEWGRSINFDGPGCEGARAFVAANVAMWVGEYHIDGFRIDATQNVYDFDDGHEHVLALIARTAREAARGRRVLVVGENEPQEVRLLRDPADGGMGLDALWNDDFHHAARVALTGRREAYYTDYRGSPQELVSAVRHGFLYQGQRYRWQKQARGTPAFDLSPDRFVLFLQNHDQIANAARGLPVTRLTSAARLRAMTAVLLLAPGTPLLFQGQEWGSTRPFYYFAELVPGIEALVAEGRRRSCSQFPSAATPEVEARMAPPAARATFEASQLDWDECARNAPARALHRDLLRLRREDSCLSLCSRPEGAVIGERAFVLRSFGHGGDDRLLLVNLGQDLVLDEMPEPLLAPPAGGDWQAFWSSEHPDYGGIGAPPLGPDAAWRLAAESAVLLRPGPPSSHRKSGLDKALAASAAARELQAKET
jgi:maltooligosyltrehalose trehalohydrolase